MKLFGNIFIITLIKSLFIGDLYVREEFIQNRKANDT